jgi:hypothetical protein
MEHISKPIDRVMEIAKGARDGDFEKRREIKRLVNGVNRRAAKALAGQGRAGL